MKKTRHGADLYALETKYHYRPEEIRDFSSNINPLGPSPKAMEAAAKNIRALCRYPDPEYRKLKAAMADYLKVSPEAVLLGSGTSQLIQEAIAHIKPNRALINSPCYSEYARELEKIGAEIFEYHLDYQKISSRAWTKSSPKFVVRPWTFTCSPIPTTPRAPF